MLYLAPLSSGNMSLKIGPIIKVILVQTLILHFTIGLPEKPSLNERNATDNFNNLTARPNLFASCSDYPDSFPSLLDVRCYSVSEPWKYVYAVGQTSYAPTPAFVTCNLMQYPWGWNSFDRALRLPLTMLHENTRRSIRLNFLRFFNW